MTYVKERKVKIEVDWKQASTKRGLIFMIAGIASLVLYFKGDTEAAQSVIAGSATLVGLMGFAVKD